MWTLFRKIRFSISPFMDNQQQGANSYACKPTASALAIFLELGIELIGPINTETGFLINVRDIDQQIRKHAVPIFINAVSKQYPQQRDISFTDLTKLLHQTHTVLGDSFKTVSINKIILNLNPYINISIQTKRLDMIYYTEKFEFAAMHKLWNHNFDESRNYELFGKCANPSGHGHNYVVEVTVKGRSMETINTLSIQKKVAREIINTLDHKNLNADVPYFNTVNPTIENIAVYAWDQLSHQLDSAELHCITIWESERTSCSYYGQKH